MDTGLLTGVWVLRSVLGMDNVTEYVDFLYFAWQNHGLAPACKTVRRMVGEDQELLRAINHELNNRLPNNMKAPAGNSRNQLLD